MIYYSTSYEQTRAIAEEFAKKLVPGDIVTLDGDLGAGKTAFTGGLAIGLGIDRYVTSPTFTIVNEYHGGKIPLYHFDVYRLGSMDDLYDIGWEEYANGSAVCVVEWADLVREGLEPPYYEVRIIKKGTTDDSREISIDYKGARE